MTKPNLLRIIITLLVIIGVFIAGYYLPPLAEQEQQEVREWMAENPNSEVCGLGGMFCLLMECFVIFAATMVIVTTWNIGRNEQK